MASTRRMFDQPFTCAPFVANSLHQRSFDGYRKRAAGFSAIGNAEEFDIAPFMTTAPMVSSFGDMARLGLLESFRPSAGNETVVINDIDCTMRYPLPSLFFVFFEYDGRLRLTMVSGKDFASGQDMEMRSRVIKEMFDALI